MSTFKLPDVDGDVEVQLTGDLQKEELLKFPAFKNWVNRLTSSLALQTQHENHPSHKFPYRLQSIKIDSYVNFGSRGLGFVNLTASIVNSKGEKGEKLPGSILLRGPSVGMLCILQPNDLPADSQDEKWVIMTSQPRVAAGSLEFLELPAGMVDGSTFTGTAAKEIEEEVGLVIKEDELINLSELAGVENSSIVKRERKGDDKKGKKDEDKNGKKGEEKVEEVKEERKEEDLPNAMFPSAGGCDEYIPLFLYESRVSRENLDALRGKLTGLRSEGENIKLKLVKFEDLWIEGARDAKALGALALYDGLKRSGKL